MKILFSTNNKEAPSTVFNVKAFKRFAFDNEIQIDFYNNNYSEYDIILFMGYDNDIEKARIVNPKAKIGVIDPRPPSTIQPIGADFLIANGIEMQDWYYSVCENIFIYYIYPTLEIKDKIHRNDDKLILGYHGNKLHLQAMFPRISNAINKLCKRFNIELWTMYNVDIHGELNDSYKKNIQFKLKYIQWSEENYINYLSNVDIGLVPGLIPFKNELRAKNKITPIKKKFNEHPTDYLLRFKSTSNPGRIFVFSQLKIPVIADMLPSSLQIIEDGFNGYIAYSTDSWYHKMKILANSKQQREYLANNMMSVFRNKYSYDVLNIKMYKFFNKMLGR